MIATVYAFPYSFSGAVSTRVSNALGAGDARGAAAATVCSLTIVAIGQSFFGVLMLVGAKWWAYAFTNERGVVDLAASAFPVVAATCLGDGVNAVMAGEFIRFPSALLTLLETCVFSSHC